jgi:Rps23 Pro-64 3,4-dihydroxylase Tpa1-like proline 4-hydroxylase
MLNRAHDTAALAAKFAAKQSLEIEDYLDPEFAKTFSKWLYKEMPNEWWFTSHKEYTQQENKSYNKTQIIQCKPKNKDRIQFETKKSYNLFNSGKFSYVFDRTTEHKANCPCKLCDFRRYLNSSDHLNFLSSVIGDKLTTTRETFASRFTAGQFLSPHHDLNKGKVGFVLNLTPKWRAEWGGLLHILENDYKTLKKVIIPSFNKLTLFTIPEQGGLPHFVSHVVPDTTQKRISYTGWFA